MKLKVPRYETKSFKRGIIFETKWRFPVYWENLRFRIC